ncbi:MAG: NAD(+) synthase [Eubacteriales bacterium]|nr:NAD(+) synthase [Eubacteriales bacterium]
MKDGYVRVASITPKIRVADCEYNTAQIKEGMKKAYENKVAVALFPELCITGYTCNDLFLQNTLIDGALKALVELKKYSLELKGMITMVGLPYVYNGKLYNVVATIMNGVILGLVPKMYIPNYGEFYERRQFTEGFSCNAETVIDCEKVPIGGSLLFTFCNSPKLKIGVEICEDLWTVCPPSIRHAMNGATLILNASASNETIGKADYRRSLVNGQSARLVCAYAYSSAGEGESTQDIVFGGHNLICENGTVLAEAKRFANETVYADIDVERIWSERRRMSTFNVNVDDNVYDGYKEIECPDLREEELELVRYFDKAPFVPDDKSERDRRCEEILDIQTYGLKKRLDHIKCKSAVVGISGGLDSTLALLVTVRAFDLLGLDRKGIVCVTMPCFGTTDRTYNNALEMSRSLGCTLREINIMKAVRQHFEDIGHDESVHDITYENGQARERTRILMDIANQTNGIVIGTGDMSELALGWATYNGDHMSMYGVNASVPKTLVRHLVRYYADTCGDVSLSGVLTDVLDTPVSPELLPPNEDGSIHQKTEDLVGPYELHDFFMYHMLRFQVGPSKLYRIAKIAFKEEYDDPTIYKWLRTFIWRFFAQQFKRSCLPDGPKVGSVAVSPRGDLRMPSDACGDLWMKELDNIREKEDCLK